MSFSLSVRGWFLLLVFVGGSIFGSNNGCQKISFLQCPFRSISAC